MYIIFKFTELRVTALRDNISLHELVKNILYGIFTFLKRKHPKLLLPIPLGVVLSLTAPPSIHHSPQSPPYYPFFSFSSSFFSSSFSFSSSSFSFFSSFFSFAFSSSSSSSSSSYYYYYYYY
jgi:hypothetical protein